MTKDDYVLICKKCGDELGIEYVPDEQTTQEPVALIKHENGNYSPNHQWQGLTDNEIDNLWNTSYVNGCLSFEHRLFFSRAIEQALKEKNG